MNRDLLIQAITAVCAMALLCSPARAQAPAEGKVADSKLEFEVASIKASAPFGNGPIRIGRGGGPGSNDPGRVNYFNSALRDLLMNAYGVKRNQVSGPDWLDTERFDIVAKVPEGSTKEQVSIMLQNLLADRFKAVVHRETKELPIYALVVGSKGPKLKEAAQPAEGGRGADLPPLPPRMGPPKMDADGCPQPPPAFAGRGMNFVMMTMNGACSVSTGQTLSNFADMLSNQFDRPVVDQTGLTGKYDFKLRYDPSSIPGRRGMGMVMMAGPPPGGMPGGGDGGRRGPDAQEREPAPNIFAAVQEQLGLKLEAKRAPVDLLVVDHIEKTPTEN